MTIKEIKPGLLLIIALMLLISSGAISQNSTKRGGVGFRVDENPPLSRVHSYDSLFSKYGLKYTFAVTSYILPLVPDYVDTLRALSLRGVELMDNTPTHSTQFFNIINNADTNLFRNKTGVDHISGQKICLKYVSCDTTHSHGEGGINLFGNMVVSYNPGEFHDLLSPSAYFAVYLSAPVNHLCLFYNVKSTNVTDPDTLYIKSFWDEPLTLGDHWFFNYHKLRNDNVVMHDSAVKILAKRSLDIFSSVNLDRPYTWIHPEGQSPWISPAQLQNIMASKLNYKQASSFKNPSFFCYNEFNPLNRKQFGILSESEHAYDYYAFKTQIADAVAKHFVLFDVGKLANYGTGSSWGDYLMLKGWILGWCNTKGIPVRTYSEWKSIIYDSVPNKTVNIFPKLDVDLDENHWPDGFDNDTALIKGVYDTTQGVSFSGNRSFRLNGGGTICRVTGLGGLEKKTNYFSFYLKNTDTAASSLVKLTVNFPETGDTLFIDSYAGVNTYLKTSMILNVPDSVSIANFTFSRDTAYHDSLYLSGLELRSTGFLNKSAYPLQEKTANVLFDNINLKNLVADTSLPNLLTWTFKGNHFINFKVVSNIWMKMNRPNSFWIGKDSVWAIAHSPEGFADSCFFRFKSDSIPAACAGAPINISIMDTLTSSDYIRWTSSPFDSTFGDTTIFNPTVTPKQSTWYKVKVYNLMGNIYKDSVRIIRHPYPVPGLFKDSSICKGRSVVLTAAGGTHYLWSTGDTVASITVKPDTLTQYTVHVANQWNCSTDDTTLIHVASIPVVTLTGLIPQYCVNDDSCYLMAGTPWYGKFGGSSGVSGSLFCPKNATIGKDTVWFQVTTPQGCYNADTVYVTINSPPSIPKLPDTSLCGNKSIVLDAGVGADNYLWSNGSTYQSTTVDSVHHGLGLLKVWVYATKQSCVSKDTAMITFIKCSTGVNDQASNGVFAVYPNPFSESIFIMMNEQLGSADNASLLNLRGEVIASAHLKDKTTILPAKDVVPGIYFLLLKHNDREYYVKIVKN